MLRKRIVIYLYNNRLLIAGIIFLLFNLSSSFSKSLLTSSYFTKSRYLFQSLLLGICNFSSFTKSINNICIIILPIHIFSSQHINVLQQFLCTLLELM